MKRYIILIAAALIFTCCAKKSDFENLLNRVDNLEGQKITSVEGQISNINNSVADLQTAKELIDNSIAELKKDDGAIRSESQQLGKDIKALKAYADSLSDGNVSWVETTFSTLKMMSEIQTRLETLEKLAPELKTALSDAEESVKKWVGVQLEGYATLAQLDAAITASEAKSKGWIAAVNDSVANLRKDLGTTKELLTKDYQDAIKAAIDEHSGKVTKEIAEQIKEAKDAIDKDVQAINERIDGLEGRIKKVEETISKIEKQISDINASITATEASIKEIEETLDGKIVDLTTALQLLKEDLEAAKKQLQEECASAVKTAIDEYSGKVTKEITDKIDAAKTDLETQINSIKDRLTSLESRMTAAETKIAEFLGRIQSIAVVPDYTDGSVKMERESNTTVRFEVNPVEAAKAFVATEGAKAFFSFQAVEAQTRASSFMNFTVESVKMDENDEFVEVAIAPNPAFTTESTMMARLKIEANAGKGNYVCKTSRYFPIVSQKKDRYLAFAKDTILRVTTDSPVQCSLSGVTEGGVTFSSSNTLVVIVNSAGQATIQGPGVAFITASCPETDEYLSGSVSFKFTVNKMKRDLMFSIDSVFVFFDETVPKNNLSGTLEGPTTYSSSNTQVATVDNDGKVTQVGSGVTTITVTVGETARYQEESASYKLRVAPKDAVHGVFSVSATKKVVFSKGNLQANINDAGEPTAWSFATTQYNVIGKGGANGTIGSAAGCVDLFGWPTLETHYGIYNSITPADYKGTFVDWGTAYCNSNSITPESTWRTLSATEWRYLLDARSASTIASVENARFVKANVGGINGVLLFPDDFTWDYATMGTIKNDINAKVTDWLSISTYTITEFAAIQAAGAVFLPVDGYREGSTVNYMVDIGYYWSTSSLTPDNSYAWRIDNTHLEEFITSKYMGSSVRLVSDL